MSNSVVSPVGLTARTNNHGAQIMNLWVTRQNQSFTISNQEEFVDLHLINSVVELVGEPGQGSTGWMNQGYQPEATAAIDQYRGHNMTTNLLWDVNEFGSTSVVYGIRSPNRIVSRPGLTHSHCNITIEGMTKTHQFKQDRGVVGNSLNLVVPTDQGLAPMRSALMTWPTTPLKMERVHLSPKITVHVDFLGNGPAPSKVARFVEDWADLSGNGDVIPISADIRRNTDGEVRYFENNDEGTSSVAQCIVPSNLIESVKLTFEVIPKTFL